MIASWLQLVSCLVQKDVTLDAQTPSQNGGSISYNSDTVSVSGTDYNINVQTQNGYDMKLSLDESWGFTSTVNSSTILTIDGSTNPSHHDCDFMIVFSVGDSQYLSYFTHLDDHNVKNKMYTSMSTLQTIEPVSQWIIDNIPDQRYNRISNNGQWFNVKWRKQVLWPLKFIITNDPINNKCYFEFYHNETVSLAQQWTLDGSFVANQNMDVYIMGDSRHEQFTISSLNIQLIHELVPTQTTTNDPTPAPSHNPTSAPTNDPTLSPTNNPISSPTMNPTPSPTNIPTSDPTTNPIPSPTNNPTPSPTPTANPTLIPTTLSPSYSTATPDPASSAITVYTKSVKNKKTKKN